MLCSKTVCTSFYSISQLLRHHNITLLFICPHTHATLSLILGSNVLPYSPVSEIPGWISFIGVSRYFGHLQFTLLKRTVIKLFNHELCERQHMMPSFPAYLLFMGKTSRHTLTSSHKLQSHQFRFNIHWEVCTANTSRRTQRGLLHLQLIDTPQTLNPDSGLLMLTAKLQKKYTVSWRSHQT